MTIKLLTVSDLHQSRQLYDQLEQAVRQHQPDLVGIVGDGIDMADDEQFELKKIDCGRRLSRLPCHDVIFVRGNHEASAWLDFTRGWHESGRPLHALNRNAFVHGPMVIVGFPCLMGDEFHYADGESPKKPKSLDWLDVIMKAHGPAAKGIWLMHEPPTGIGISSRREMELCIPQWKTAITRYDPMTTISGHDHETAMKRNSWHSQLGKTVCINAGQTHDGPLHYCILECGFASDTPSQPTMISATAYPWNETVVVDERHHG